jgi:hypothetical protein
VHSIVALQMAREPKPDLLLHVDRQRAIAGAVTTAHDLAQLLALLVFEYRERNAQKKPLRIEMSADVLLGLQGHKESGFGLEKSVGGYAFDGVEIVSKPGQFLPFVLRP